MGPGPKTPALPASLAAPPLPPPATQRPQSDPIHQEEALTTPTTDAEAYAHLVGLLSVLSRTVQDKVGKLEGRLQNMEGMVTHVENSSFRFKPRTRHPRSFSVG